MTDFMASEREYIRRDVADGFQLRTWRTGPRKDQPKLPPAAKSLLDRGMMRLDGIAKLTDAETCANSRKTLASHHAA
jgi:hypothetical protein